MIPANFKHVELPPAPPVTQHVHTHIQTGGITISVHPIKDHVLKNPFSDTQRVKIVWFLYLLIVTEFDPLISYWPVLGTDQSRKTNDSS